MHYPFSTNVYNMLCWLGRTGLPALATAVVAITAVIGYQEIGGIIAGILTAITVMLNSLTNESKKVWISESVTTNSTSESE